MQYKYCGKSGLQLPLISLGLWHNFGFEDDTQTARKMILHAFDKGITHIDIANNYGPPPGAAETTFGRILKNDLAAHRDELIISSKAGHLMWDGRYGDGGSRKYLMASINQSLKRTNLEYFDIFYSHRYDPKTPIEETMQALVDIVRQGKALYIGISKYPPKEAQRAFDYLKENNVPCLIFQDKYNLLHRNVENKILDLCEENGTGFIAFSPLSQGILTEKYLNEIPQYSRAKDAHGYLKTSQITETDLEKVRTLQPLAEKRNQTIAQLSLAWILNNPKVTSVIVGARNLEQLQANIDTLENLHLSSEEVSNINNIFL